MSVEQEVWNYFKAKNLPEKTISAIMGNIHGESNFNVGMIEGGSGIGFGLCQWSFERRTALEAYGTDVTHQLNFLWSEMTGENCSVTGATYQWIEKSPYLTHDVFMSGSGSIDDLTASFCFCWERPDYDSSHIAERQQYANIYFTTYGGATPPPITGTIKLKNNYLYGFTDGLLGRKFTSKNKTFDLVKTYGDVAVIKDGTRILYVPKKNVIVIK